MTLLLAALALATERPVLGDEPCEPRGLRAGVALTPACDGVALSLARSQWYAEVVVWADEQAAMRRIETAACADSLSAAASRETYWRGMAERPAPVVHPAVVFGAGVGAGIVVVLGGALAVRWASEADVTPGD